MPDFVRLSKRFQRGVAGLEEVIRTYQSLIQIPPLLDLLIQAEQRRNAEVNEDMEKIDLITTTWTEKLQVCRESPFFHHCVLNLASFLSQKSHNDLSGFRDMVEETIDLDQLEQ